MRTFVSLWLVSIVAVAIAAPAVADDATTVIRYVGGAWAESRAFSFGGVCTGTSVPDHQGDWHDVPVVVGGACAIDLRGATRIRIVIHDDALDGLVSQPFRFGLWGQAPVLEESCREQGIDWNEVELDVPAGCTYLDVYLSPVATTGTITVQRL